MSTRKRTTDKDKPPKYVGLDTETVNGRAVLICTPDLACYPESWRGCVDFLFSTGARDYITWNVTYDSQAILSYVPRTVMARLREHNRVRYRSCSIRYIPRKQLQITNHRIGRTVAFWDCYPYFDSSLDAAAGTWLGERKMLIPKKWLEDMSVPLSRPRDRARVELYCKRDAGLTQRLWEIVEAQYIAIGVSPHRAPGPATIARRAFPEIYDFRNVPRRVQGLFRRSYYGGRSEIVRRGRVGRAYYYDIHSAYPSALEQCEDPRESTLVLARRGKPPRSDAMYGTYKTRVEIPLDTPFGPLPYRSNNHPLIYPVGVFLTWITRPELEMLRAYGFNHEVLGGAELLRTGAAPLFPPGVIRELYARRKANPNVALALKKTMNCLYGKFAETRVIHVQHKHGYLPCSARRGEDGRWRYPIEIPTTHTHYAVAAHVTATIRVRLFAAAMHYPKSVVSMATDGIVTTRKLPLKRGSGLGQWGVSYEAAEFVQLGNGIYCYRITGERDWNERRRGIRDPGFYERVHNRRRRTVPVCVMRAISLAEAARTGYRNLNIMTRITKNLDVNMDTKRVWPAELRTYAEAFRSQQRSRPWIIAPRGVIQ